MRGHRCQELRVATKTTEKNSDSTERTYSVLWQPTDSVLSTSLIFAIFFQHLLTVVYYLYLVHPFSFLIFIVESRKELSHDRSRARGSRRQKSRFFHAVDAILRLLIVDLIFRNFSATFATFCHFSKIPIFFLNVRLSCLQHHILPTAITTYT